MKRILFFMMMIMFSVVMVAAPVSWTDWVSSANAYSVSGQLLVGSTVVDVEYSSTSAYNFVQTSGGTNYWTGSAYTNGTVDNAPTPSDIISLNTGGTVTVTFSQAIEDPLVALASWNGNVADFGTAITVDSTGTGYWGTGTAIVNTAGTGFTGSGELHGIIKLSGSFTSITFTHTSENWHGMTIGVTGLAVPEPTALSLLGIGIVLAFISKKR